MKALFYYILFFLLLQGSIGALDDSVLIECSSDKDLLENVNKVISTKEDSIIGLNAKVNNESLSSNAKISSIEPSENSEKKNEAVDKVISAGKDTTNELKTDVVKDEDIESKAKAVATVVSENNDETVEDVYLEIFSNIVDEQYISQKATGVNSCPPLELSLEVLFNMIEAENLTALLNRDKIEEALQDAYFARADLLPQVGLLVTQNRAKIVNDFGSGDTTFTNSLFNATLVGSFTIFDLTKIAGYQEAKMGIVISELNYNAILQQILNQSATLYFTHVRNLRGLNVIDANLAEARILLDLAKTRFDVGVASPIDVTRAEVQEAIYERQRQQLAVLIKQSELNLKTLLDLDMEQIIIIPNVKLDNKAPTLAPALTIPTLNSVLENRWDYLVSSETLALRKYERKAADWAYYPSVFMEASGNSWGFAAPEPFSGTWAPEWSVTLSVSMPIFDGFRIRSNILKQESRVRQQTDTLLDLANNISAEITLNSFTLESRYKEIDLVYRQVGLGEKELQLAKTRFKEGVADNTEVVNAQTKLALAADSLVQIMFSYDVARLEWARTLGDVRLILKDSILKDGT